MAPVGVSDEEQPLVVRCLDDGQSYVVDPSKSGLVETSGTIIGVVKSKEETGYYGGGLVVREAAEPEALDSDVKVSSKARRGQRLRESVGLKAKTKDVGFEAARHRVAVHRRRVAKLDETLKRRESLLRQLASCETDLAARLEDLAASSPIEAAAASLSRDVARVKTELESRLLPESSKAFTEILSKWCEDLDKSDAETYRDQENARIQLDHYEEKAAQLRKAKEKRDLAALEKAANDAKNEVVKTKAPTTTSAADEKYYRNEAKLKAARNEYQSVTAAGVRVYDSTLVDRWHDLTPLIGRILAFEMNMAKLRGHDAEPNLRACHQALKEIPTNLVPLRSRLYFAKINQAPPQQQLTSLIQAEDLKTLQDSHGSPPSTPSEEDETNDVQVIDENHGILGAEQD